MLYSFWDSDMEASVLQLLYHAPLKQQPWGRVAVEAVAPCQIAKRAITPTRAPHRCRRFLEQNPSEVTGGAAAADQTA